MELRTSDQWQILCNIKVLDPDGWDRSRFQYSWYEEKISREEFERRLAFSTIEGFNVSKIWKDKANPSDLRLEKNEGLHK